MKHILTILLLTFFSNTLLAASPLNKNTAEQYFSATRGLEVFEENHPEIAERFDSSDYTDKEKLMEMVQKDPQFSALEKVVKASGLSSFEAFYDLGIKITGAMMAIQMEQMPAGMSMEQMFSTQEASIERMKSMGVPKAELDKMKQEVEKQKAGIANMMKLAQHASEQDKAFVRENMAWIMENMSQDESTENDTDW